MIRVKIAQRSRVALYFVGAAAFLVFFRLLAVLLHSYWDAYDYGLWTAGDGKLVSDKLLERGQNSAFFEEFQKLVREIGSATSSAHGEADAVCSVLDFRDDTASLSPAVLGPKGWRNWEAGTHLQVYRGLLSRHSDEYEQNPNDAQVRARLAEQLQKAAPDFQAFAGHIVDLYKAAEKGHEQDNIHPSIVLSKALKIDEISGWHASVPWIYVAREDGCQLSYPASYVHLDPKYNPLKRPWYTETLDASKQAGAVQILTKPYVDYSAHVRDSFFVVRTVAQKVQAGEHTYVVCVDVLWNHKSFSPNAAALPAIQFALTDSVLAALAHATALNQDINLTLIGLAAIVVATVVHYWSRRPNRVPEWRLAVAGKAFIGSPSLIKIKTSKGSHLEETEKSGVAIDSSRLAFLRWISLARERTSRDAQSTTTESEETIQVPQNDPSIRGIEVWTLAEIVRREKHFAGLEVEVQRGIREYSVRVEYGAAAMPQVVFRDARNLLENEAAKRQLEWPVLKCIFTGRRSFGESLVSESSTFLPVGLSPDDSLETIVDTCNRSYNGRYPFVDGLALVGAMYRSSAIRGVVRDYYLAELLKRDRFEILSQGHVIDRTVLVEDRDAWMRIVAEHRGRIEQITQEARQMGAQLWIVYVADLPDPLRRVREKDFGLIGDKAVVVTEDYVLEKRVTGTSSLEELRVRGYLSTREADLKYYEYFHRQIVLHRRDLRSDITSKPY